jgi:phosphoribosylformylglycinamidine synthase
MPVQVLVLRTAGTNCDQESAYAFQLAGAEPTLLHVNEVRDEPELLDRFQILAIPGGFSYGDDLGAGKVLANEMLASLRPALERFLDAGKLIIGICNGFQVLVKTGLLPGLDRWRQQATLTFNDSHKFEDRWVHLQAPENTCCAFVEAGESVYWPVAHAEGKFVVENEDVLDQLRENGQIIYRYTTEDGDAPEYPANPNGSVDNIAGICDPTGRVVGMMPHPERHCLPVHDPRWPRRGLADEGEGMPFFRRAVEFVERELGVTAG